jgi:hypothetical protein
MLYGVLLLHRHCVVKFQDLILMCTYTHVAALTCLFVCLITLLYPTHLDMLGLLQNDSENQCPIMSIFLSILLPATPLLPVYVNNNLRTIEAFLWNILEKSMRKLSYCVQTGQFERCYMKACAFLHTCAIHITLDYSAGARIWGNHKLSGTADFWRCEDSITVSPYVHFLSCF